MIKTATITINKTPDMDLIKSIILDPKLFALSYGQSTSPLDFEVEQNGFEYLLITDASTTIGCVQIRPLTRILLECHIYILPEFWGKDISTEATIQGFKWAKQNGYHKVFTDVPVECSNVRNLLKRTGWTQCGYIKDGVVFNNTLQDLIFFERGL